MEPAACAEPAFGVGVGSTCVNQTMGMECWAYCTRGYDGAIALLDVRVRTKERPSHIVAKRMQQPTRCSSSSLQIPLCARRDTWPWRQVRVFWPRAIGLVFPPVFHCEESDMPA